MSMMTLVKLLKNISIDSRNEDVFMEENNVEKINEKYLQVSESRIKNTIKEYKKGQPFSWVLSSSFACMVSFLTAFASYSSNDNVWKWAFLILVCISTLVFLVFGVITLVRKRIGHGTEKWFLEEIKNNHPPKDTHYSVNSKVLFNIINFILIIGIPIAVLLTVLGCNGWDISNKEWSSVFWVIWSIGSLCSLLFGTFINAYFAYLFFGFEDGFPDIPFI